MSQPRSYPEGVPCWIDLEAEDVDAAAAFYGQLFGWTFATATPPGVPFRYLIAQLDGLDVAGIGGPAATGPTAPPVAWNTYIAVDDADAAAERVVAEGGEVVVPPADAGEGGRSVGCADPAGVRFRLWQPRRRLGAQVANTPGGWNFSDLYAADPSADGAFYERVFHWSIDDLGFATLIRLPGYGDHLAATSDPDLYERQADVLVPPGFADAVGWLAPVGPGEQPHWHVTFTVADRDETAATAQRLGATVLSRSDTDWTKDVLIRDPQGAEFTGSEFTPPSA